MKDETDKLTKDMHTPAITNLALDLLAPSKTNPRSRRGFDEASLNEMAATIKSHGVMQPILVRRAAAQPAAKASWPFPPAGIGNEKAQYEIIAGERRYRAARLAGLADIPVLIRELTDLEVLHMQLIENKQRKDLDELEEAEGYERLMKQQDTDGKPYTVELLSTLQGVSKATIYARLKLLALCPDARDAFFDGKIDASTALLIARIPVEKLQLQALKKVTEVAGYGNQFMATGDKMSFRRAREILQSEFMLDLDRAPFDTKDAALLPKSGNCTACPKRTGNAPDLFDDVKSKWAVKNKKEPQTMTRIAEIEGIDPAKLRADFAAEEKLAATKKTAPTPIPAAPAANKPSTPSFSWPFPTPHYEPAKSTAKKAKTKAATAA